MGQKSQGLKQKQPFLGQLSSQAWQQVNQFVCYLGNYNKVPQKNAL